MRTVYGLQAIAALLLSCTLLSCDGTEPVHTPELVLPEFSLEEWAHALSENDLLRFAHMLHEEYCYYAHCDGVQSGFTNDKEVEIAMLECAAVPAECSSPIPFRGINIEFIEVLNDWVACSSEDPFFGEVDDVEVSVCRISLDYLIDDGAEAMSVFGELHFYRKIEDACGARLMGIVDDTCSDGEGVYSWEHIRRLLCD